MTRQHDILIGTAYYPEHDHESEWEHDAALMKELGINCIRVGEFCWSRLQQADGRYTFDWLDRLIDLFESYGIKTVLATPSATPPAWFCEKYQDLPCVTADGRKGLFGGRRHYSAFHQAYRQHCRDMAEKLASQYGNNPSVIGWQIDNEIGTYYLVDCSQPAVKAFQQWTRDKYKTVEELNKRWGLIFWNQEIAHFEQLPPPTEMMTTRNPSFLLDYNRFCLEGVADFILNQAEVIHQHARNQFIVASTPEHASLKLQEMQQARGVQWVNAVSLHNYPELKPQKNQNAMHLNRFRMLAQDKPLYVLEQQIGSGHTTTGGVDAQISRFWTLEALANGVKSVFWFHWRRFRTGCEWRLSSIVERDRKKRRMYNVLQSVVKEIDAIAPILKHAELQTDIQILYSQDNILGFDRASAPEFWMQIQLPDALQHRFPMWEKSMRENVYSPLIALGQNLAFVSETQQWNLQKPLIAIDLDICSQVLAGRLEEFCRNGGTLICFAGAGERDSFGAHNDVPPPGCLAELFGVQLDDYYPLGAECGTAFDHQQGRNVKDESPQSVQTQTTITINGQTLNVDVRHGEMLELHDAVVVALYSDEKTANKPVISQRMIGKGKAIYIGAFPADFDNAVMLYQQLIDDLPKQTIPYQELKMKSDTENYRFIVNNSAMSYPLERPVDDTITGKRFTQIAGYDVLLEKYSSH